MAAPVWLMRATDWPGSLLLGAALGIAILHPAMIAVHRLGRSRATEALDGWWWLPHGPEWLVYALIGVAIVWIGRSIRLTRRRLRAARQPFRHRLLVTLLAGGEREDVEFKASARWDHRESRMNRELETAVARTIAAFLNGRGGTLLIGLADDGQAIGIECDYQTLRRPNADGYQQFLVGLVATTMGGAAAALIHVSFTGLAGHELCRVDVEPSNVPVYLRDNRVARYFVRSGNTTRELDVAEALTHIERRGVSPAHHERSVIP